MQKYTVTLSLEVEAVNPEIAAKAAYGLIYNNPPRTFAVKDAAAISKDVTLDYATAKEVRQQIDAISEAEEAGASNEEIDAVLKQHGYKIQEQNP